MRETRETTATDLGSTKKVQEQEPKLSRDASRELDALIAEKVMGWERSVVGNTPWQMIPPGEDRYIVRNVPHYSTDIAAAWLVVEKLRPYHFDLGLYNDGWLCRLCVGNDNSRHFEAYGGRRGGDYHAPENAALAICRAALLAVGAA